MTSLAWPVHLQVLAKIAAPTRKLTPEEYNEAHTIAEGDPLRDVIRDLVARGFVAMVPNRRPEIDCEDYAVLTEAGRAELRKIGVEVES